MRKLLLLLSIIGMSIFLAHAVYALSESTVLNVTANSVVACSVSVQDLNFGDFDGSLKVTTGDIVVTCTQDVPYTIALDAGQNYNVDISPYRKMSDGSGHYIDYDITNTPTGNVGDEGYGNTFPGSPIVDTGNGTAQSHQINSRAFAGIVPAGSYSDVVQVTVNY